jgi:serine/threonine protein phosphatase PrpC
VHESVRENVASSELSGSTCCLTLIHGHKIYSANCGDSRAILVNRQRKITVLTNDHKVDVEIEPEVKANNVNVQMCSCSIVFNCFSPNKPAVNK